MKLTSIPLLPFSYKSAQGIIHALQPLSAVLLKFSPSLEIQLEELDSPLGAKHYVAGAVFSFVFYLFFFGIVLTIYTFMAGQLENFTARVLIFLFSFAAAFSILAYILLVPKWLTGKKKLEVERDLLFAVNHLAIQTSAGVPLFDSLVSLSERYDDPKLNYGQISKEFEAIVKEVRGGRDLAAALEQSASKNTSLYYKKTLWQLANANKSGANIGFVLSQVSEFLANEQRIMVRAYGSQLNTLALFYMFSCIVAPTMGIVLLTIATTLTPLEFNELFFFGILAILVMFQVTFLGLIKNRRPTVVL